MLKILSADELNDLLKPFSWTAENTKIPNFQNVPVPHRTRHCDDAIKDVVVQLALTEILCGLSNPLYMLVPKTNAEDIFDNLLCFFKDVYEIGERGNAFVYRVGRPKKNAQPMYTDAIRRGEIHPLFVQCWKNHFRLKAFKDQNTIEALYKPEMTASCHTVGKDTLIQYIELLSYPLFVTIPLIMHQNDLQSCELISHFNHAQFSTYLSGYDTNDEFYSISMALQHA